MNYMSGFKKGIKKTIKTICWSPRGKPGILAILFFLDSHSRYVHSWISRHVKKGGVILDVGAQTFRYTKYRETDYILGSDLVSESEGYLGWQEEELVEFAKQKNMFPTISNCEELPFRSNSIDLLVLIEVIEHVPKDDQAISEIARVLKSSGKLLLTTPNGNEVPNTNPYHLRHYVPEELETMCRKYFQNVSLKFHFTNTTLHMKQELAGGRISRILWYWMYELYLAFFSKGDKGGYTLCVVCTNPRINPIQDLENVESIQELLVCPECKAELWEKKDNLVCNACGKIYDVVNNIPVLLTKVPHHQKGNGPPPVSQS